MRKSIWPKEISEGCCVKIVYRRTTLRLLEPTYHLEHDLYMCRVTSSYFMHWVNAPTREGALDAALLAGKAAVDRTCAVHGVKEVIGY